LKFERCGPGIKRNLEIDSFGIVVQGVHRLRAKGSRLFV